MNPLTLRQKRRLNKVLKVLDHSINEFCKEHEYSRTDRDLGSLPGRILRKHGDFERIIQVVLWVDENGEYPETPSNETRFGFSWVAIVQQARVQYRISELSILPLFLLQPRMRSLLGDAEARMTALQPSDIINRGKRFDLDAPFPQS